MKKALLAILCVTQSVAFGQNVIPNPGFEEHTDCSPYLGTGGATTPLCTDWTPATKGSSDYYNVCNPGIITGVPKNFFGKMMPESGNAYVGEYTYAPQAPNGSNEYIMTSLPALTPGQKYRLSMYVVLGKYCNFATHAPDAFFSTYGSPDTSITRALPVTPQISFASAGYITDTSSWVHLSGSFIADSAYTYIIIGSFRDSAHTMPQQVSAPPEPGPVTDMVGAYYYIDSVTLEAYDATTVAAVNSNAAQLRVTPNPVTANATIQFANPNGADNTLCIYNQAGMLVDKREHVTGNSVQLETRNLSSGLYYCRLTSQLAEPVTARFIVQ